MTDSEKLQAIERSFDKVFNMQEDIQIRQTSNRVRMCLGADYRVIQGSYIDALLKLTGELK